LRIEHIMQWKRLITLFAGPWLLPASLALAAEPFNIQPYGSFKHLADTASIKGVVKLAPLGGEKGTYGVGAQAGLRGEILLWDGRMLVTRGHSPIGSTEPVTAADEAVLFVRGKVEDWQAVAVATDMTQAQFEAFVVDSAKKAGLSVENAFPFAVRGGKLDVVWHVVTGPASPSAKPTGAHSGGQGDTHQFGHAGMRIFRETASTGILLGFYSGAALEGVISHPGERFHLHYAKDDLSLSGHVDEYSVAKGATLMLPKR
jgi:alpha-acetolactate decarboxylase